MTHAPLFPVEREGPLHLTPCAAILRCISTTTGLPQHVILSGDRRAHIVEARHQAMWITRMLTNHSFPSIGRRFKRDHKTVLYAVNKVVRKRIEEPQYKRDTNAMLASCRQALEEGT